MKFPLFGGAMNPAGVFVNPLEGLPSVRFSRVTLARNYWLSVTDRPKVHASEMFASGLAVAARDNSCPRASCGCAGDLHPTSSPDRAHLRPSRPSKEDGYSCWR